MSSPPNPIEQACYSIAVSAARAARYFDMVANLAEMGDDRMAKLMLDAASDASVEVTARFGELSLARRVIDLDPDNRRAAA